MVECLVFGALLATAVSADLLLSNIQPISGFSNSCTTAYSTPITGCNITNFFPATHVDLPQRAPNVNKCTSDCLSGLLTMESYISNMCYKNPIPFGNHSIIGSFWLKTAAAEFCDSTTGLAMSDLPLPVMVAKALQEQPSARPTVSVTIPGGPLPPVHRSSTTADADTTSHAGPDFTFSTWAATSYPDFVTQSGGIVNVTVTLVTLPTIPASTIATPTGPSWPGAASALSSIPGVSISTDNAYTLQLCTDASDPNHCGIPYVSPTTTIEGSMTRTTPLLLFNGTLYSAPQYTMFTSAGQGWATTVPASMMATSVAAATITMATGNAGLGVNSTVLMTSPMPSTPNESMTSSGSSNETSSTVVGSVDSSSSSTSISSTITMEVQTATATRSAAKTTSSSATAEGEKGASYLALVMAWLVGFGLVV